VRQSLCSNFSGLARRSLSAVRESSFIRWRDRRCSSFKAEVVFAAVVGAMGALVAGLATFAPSLVSTATLLEAGATRWLLLAIA
jgi:hypothetical protein